jgi:hypothetical protein
MRSGNVSMKAAAWLATLGTSAYAGRAMATTIVV